MIGEPFSKNSPFDSYPAPVTAICLLFAKTSRTVISPLVKVPVLSEQITVVAPNVSADESFLIIALRLASSRAPSVRHIVTTAGKPSGTAETARAIDVSKASMMFVRGFAECATPRTKISYKASKKIITQMATIIIPSFLAKRSSFLLRGLSSVSIVWTNSAIFPNSVFMPVFVITALPLP